MRINDRRTILNNTYVIRVPTLILTGQFMYCLEYVPPKSQQTVDYSTVRGKYIRFSPDTKTFYSSHMQIYDRTTGYMTLGTDDEII